MHSYGRMTHGWVNNNKGNCIKKCNFAWNDMCCRILFYLRKGQVREREGDISLVLDECCDNNYVLMGDRCEFGIKGFGEGELISEPLLVCVLYDPFCLGV